MTQHCGCMSVSANAFAHYELARYGGVTLGASEVGQLGVSLALSVGRIGLNAQVAQMYRL